MGDDDVGVLRDAAVPYVLVRFVVEGVDAAVRDVRAAEDFQNTGANSDLDCFFFEVDEVAPV